MGDRFVIVVNEITDGENHDGVNESGGDYDWDDDGYPLDDRDLVAWLKPSAVTGWTFHHDAHPSGGWVVADWMGEAVGTNRVGIGFSEQSNDNPYDFNGDGDETDSVPTFAHFGSTFMEFPGYAIAVDSDNAGIVILGSWAFYRVSEGENGADLNNNGSGDDNLLWASHLSTGETLNLSLLNNVSGTDSVMADPLNASCAAFLIDENDYGDLNGDGDQSGFAVRYLRY